MEAINGRHSVRAYLDQPVPEEVIKQVLMAALSAPSWGNNQPWEIAIVSATGDGSLLSHCSIVWYDKEKHKGHVMPRYIRRQSKSGAYHIMLRGNERKDIFYDDEDS